MKLRIALLIILYAIITYVMNFEPAINTQLAINQANDTIGSTYNFTAYQSFRNYLWLAYVLVPILVFWKYIKQLYKATTIQNDNKGE